MPPLTPLLHFRMVDAFVAAGAAAMLFLFLSRWTESPIALVMASGWSIASNVPLFAEAGFNNPIMAATMVYLCALWLLSSRSSSSPFWAGLLIPIAVFLREAFFPTVIVSLYLATMLHGRRGLIVHVAGLATAGCALLLWLYLFRGPPGEILGYFRVDFPMLHEFLKRQMRVEDSHRWVSLRLALKPTLWLMPTAFLGGAWLLAPRSGQRAVKGLAVLLFLPPFYEIFAGKICIHYHWAQLLLGVAFLGAMGLHWLLSLGRQSNRGWLTIGGFVALAWIAGELDARTVYRAYRDAYRLSREFAPVMFWGHWDDASVERSRYLQVAKYIRDNTTPSDHIIASNGCEVIYPLSGRLPLSVNASDLSHISALKFPVRRPEVIESLRQRPPRLVIEFDAYPVALDECWPDFEQRYRLIKEFPHDNKVHYGIFAARVWKLKE
jgi:hypothetical protein